jgi:UDP-N-acetylmuramoyl-tripeptide--D-alanyl-D-alanine ligase
MSFWEYENLRSVAGGVWLARPSSQEPATSLSTDTRTIKPGQVFLALAGEQHDGHRVIADAAAKGSPLAIIDNPDALPSPLPAGLGVLKVTDTTRRALLRLAAAYRKSLEGTKVIAVVGSNGKTTTVRLIDAVLTGALRGTASIKSYNNDIGVPLTILGARPGDGYLICEVGTNSPSEIAKLSEVVAPDIAVIVSIGREHLEKLGSLAGVAREEASVLEFVRRGGAGIYNADAPHLAETIAAMPTKPNALIGFGRSPAANVRVIEESQNLSGLSFTLNDKASFRLPLLGRHNAVNAAAAVAVGRRLGLSDAHIATGLLAVRGAEMRLEQSEIGGIRLINDAYNANPDSMRAALETLAEVGKSARRRVVVLGDMLELGEHTRAEHAEMGLLLSKRRDLDLMVLVGPSMRWAAEALGSKAAAKVVRVDDLDSTHAPRIAAMLNPGDVVLLKGSRRMRLERLAAAIRDRFSAAQSAAAACG